MQRSILLQGPNDALEHFAHDNEPTSVYNSLLDRLFFSRLGLFLVRGTTLSNLLILLSISIFALACLLITRLLIPQILDDLDDDAHEIALIGR